MTKSTITYWNPLDDSNAKEWQPIEGLESIAEKLTLSMDSKTGKYTRLTRFHAGADASSFGGKSHEYPEEIFIVSGRLYDQAFDMWLETGHYASRPPGEYTGHLKQRKAVLCLRFHFQIKLTSKSTRLTNH